MQSKRSLRAHRIERPDTHTRAKGITSNNCNFDTISRWAVNHIYNLLDRRKAKELDAQRRPVGRYTNPMPSEKHMAGQGEGEKNTNREFGSQDANSRSFGRSQCRGPRIRVVFDRRRHKPKLVAEACGRMYETLQPKAIRFLFLLSNDIFSDCRFTALFARRIIASPVTSKTDSLSKLRRCCMRGHWRRSISQGFRT